MHPHPQCRILEWDSAFFGRRIATFAPVRLDDERVVAAVDWCRTNRVDCLYVLSDAEDSLGIRLLEDAGARVVDVRVTFERTLENVSKKERPAVRASRESDIPDLRALAATSHTTSRFWADEHFPRERCAELYATWIEKSCRGWADHVFVAEVEGHPVGYFSCHVREHERGELGIAAVAPSAKGRGLGGDLLDSVMTWLSENGLQRVTVATQGCNTVAQNLYQSRGFRTVKVQLWHHLWLTPDEVRS